MLSDAFDAIWNKADQSLGLNSGYYLCRASAVKIFVATINLGGLLLFPDFLNLVNLIEAFQHNYALLELRYQFWTNLVKRGVGYLSIKMCLIPLWSLKPLT